MFSKYQVECELNRKSNIINSFSIWENGLKGWHELIILAQRPSPIDGDQIHFLLIQTTLVHTLWSIQLSFCLLHNFSFDHLCFEFQPNIQNGWKCPHCSYLWTTDYEFKVYKYLIILFNVQYPLPLSTLLRFPRSKTFFYLCLWICLPLSNIYSRGICRPSLTGSCWRKHGLGRVDFTVYQIMFLLSVCEHLRSRSVNEKCCETYGEREWTHIQMICIH